MQPLDEYLSDWPFFYNFLLLRFHTSVRNSGYLANSGCHRPCQEVRLTIPTKMRYKLRRSTLPAKRHLREVIHTKACRGRTGAQPQVCTMFACRSGKRGAGWLSWTSICSWCFIPIQYYLSTLTEYDLLWRSSTPFLYRRAAEFSAI